MILGIQDAYYNVQDMDKAIYFYTTALGLKLENCGATILSESKQTWGHMLVFLDPDGNVLKLMSPAAG
jgi:predicted enzyme related to lactoylglutathione lyase